MAGLLTVAAFPPLPVGLFAYGALLPLMLAFIKDDYHLGFEKGYLYGLVLNLGVMYWLAVNKGTQWYWAGLSMLAAVLFLALNYGLIGWLVGLIGRRLGAWAGLLAWPFGLPWNIYAPLARWVLPGITSAIPKAGPCG